VEKVHSDHVLVGVGVGFKRRGLEPWRVETDQGTRRETWLNPMRRKKYLTVQIR
jgi:hypothetical protein